MSRRPTPLARAAVFTVVVWLAVIGAAEIVLRFAGFAREAPREVPAAYDKFRTDEDLIWALKPGWTGLEPNGAAVRTNALGLRGPEPTPGLRRLLLLGDSVVYGHHLETPETIPARLQARLAATGRPVEVINAGVPGYSTFQSERFYRREGGRIGAELVLLGFCLNDVTERYERLAGWGGERFFMGNVDTTTGLGPVRRLWRRSAIRAGLVRLLRGRAGRAEAVRVESLWARPESAEVEAAWAPVLAELDRLHDEVTEAGARFAVVVFPYARQVVDPSAGDAPQHRLQRHLEGRGVAVLDLLPPARGWPGGVQRLFLDANHLTAHGADLAAAEIADFVSDLEARRPTAAARH